MTRTSLLPLTLLALAACSRGDASGAAAPVAPAPAKAAPVAAAPAGAPSTTPPGVWTSKVAQGNDLYATVQTSLGTVVLKLFSKDAPETVKNFVGLATGERDWQDPRTSQTVKGRPLYAGTIFHRVIPNFMIQGGDPLGTGTGDPGYRFADEFQSGRVFDKPGLLAMANSGPNTNGSQFFITTSTPRHLDGHHTIFGEVAKGYDVVLAISEVPRGMRDRPQQPVQIVSITLSDTLP
jgi:peptidyl-prolyl cis-trans isomerase A (cyclophilin A)